MTAEIFHRHGLWVGRLPLEQQYQTWENEDIRLPLKKLTVTQTADALRLRELAPGKTVDDVLGLFRSAVPEDVDWMHKVPICRWYVLRAAFPQARIVLIRRSTQSVCESLQDKVNNPARDWQTMREHVTVRHAFIDGLAMEYGLPVVQTQEIVDGNYATLANAMRCCGVKFDPSIADQVIDRTKWHF